MAKLNFSNIRVHIDASNHHKYIELTRPPENQSGDIRFQAEDVPFIKMPDLFVAAACVGAKEGKYIGLSKKRDIFFADALDPKFQLPVLISLAYKKHGNTDVLLEPKEVMDICECWANGGISILYDIALYGEGLRPLYRIIDYIQKESPIQN